MKQIKMINESKTGPREIANGQFKIKDSGDRQAFNTGAQRDTQEGKPRFELIPPLALKRIADLYANGAKKYDDDNWSKGMPFRRFYASLLRHAFAFGNGDESEDHLASIVFNALAIIHFQEMGRSDLDDMPKWQQKQLAKPGQTVGVQQTQSSPEVSKETEAGIKLRNDLFKLSQETKRSMQEVVTAAANFSQQGLGIDEVLKRTKESLLISNEIF